MGVLIRGKHRCHYCGVGLTIDTVTIDHMKPKSKGGHTNVKNLVAACLTCNRAKADRSYAMFRAKATP